MPIPLPPAMLRLTTPRLLLRPSAASDAERAFQIQSNWNVTRMLRMAPYPPDRGDIAGWFADHPRQWGTGAAYRFAVEWDGRMIGLADVDEIAAGEGDLGYWFDEAAWGKGFAGEAGQAVVRFAFDMLGLARLRSGHAADNPASGRVLRMLGFQPLGSVTLPSLSRGTEIQQIRYRLARGIQSHPMRG